MYCMTAPQELLQEDLFISQGTGHLKGACTVDGLLVRDLQMQPKSRFAFFLRPLPARADELMLHATRYRTQMLRVVRLTPARRRCV